MVNAMNVLNAESLRRIVGRRVGDLRQAAGRRQEDVATAARECGLAWSRSKVASLEAGEKAISPEELVLLPLVLSLALGRAVTLTELLDVESDITLSTTVTWPASTVAAMFAGDQEVINRLPVPTSPRTAAIADRALRHVGEATHRLRDLGLDLMTSDARRVQAQSGEAEVKAARRLHEPRMVIDALGLRLWSRSLSAERDRRLGDVAGQPPATVRARRGQITRQLLAEMRDYIDRQGG